MNILRSILCRTHGWAMAIVLCVMLALPAFSFALDRLTLKDGHKVIEGTIVQEIDGNIFFKYKEGGVEKQKRFTMDEILKIERNVDTAPAAPAASEPAAPAKDPAKSTDTTPATTGAAAAGAAAATPAAAPKSKTPKAVVITLGDRTNGEMIGVYITAHQLRQMLPDLEKELGTDRSGVVVFRVYSGGGYLFEINRIWDAIRNDYQKRFRCVAWIESAISAAAMSSHCMSEIYFTSQANYGACTGWSGNLVAVKGVGLQQALSMMEATSRSSGYDPQIMRSMQIQEPLSATVNPDGSVSFYKDTTSGDILVNRDHEILTLNAQTAERIKFSKGTADSLDELTKLMGYKELEWVGKDVPGVKWPVSRAEQDNMDFRRKTKYDEDRTNEYYRQYQTEVAFAESVAREDRPKFVGKARQTLEKFKSMLRNNPAFNLTVFNSQDDETAKKWLEEQDKLLRELLK